MYLRLWLYVFVLNCMSCCHFGVIKHNNNNIRLIDFIHQHTYKNKHTKASNVSQKKNWSWSQIGLTVVFAGNNSSMEQSFLHAPRVPREHCRISPPRFLDECCKRQLNQGSFVLLHFQLFTFSDLYWFYLSVFSCTVLFAGTSQVIGCEDRARNDLYCVEWGVKLYSNQTKFQQLLFFPAKVPFAPGSESF